MLLKRGEVAICNKLLEEVVELIIESRRRNKKRLSEELADVFYLTLVLATWHGVRLEDIELCLGSRHSKGRVESESASSSAGVLRRLAPFQTAQGEVTLSRMLKATGFKVSHGADIVLFSPLLKTVNYKDASSRTNVFPHEIKAIKTLFEEHDLKVKVGVRPGESERYVTHRSSGSLSAIIFVAKVVVLPVTVKLLADYLKEFIDRRRKGDRGASKVDIQLVVAADGLVKEQAFALEGALERVHGELGKIQAEKTTT